MKTIIAFEVWREDCEICGIMATHFVRVAEHDHTYNLPCGCGYRSTGVAFSADDLTPLTPAEIALGMLMAEC